MRHSARFSGPIFLAAVLAAFGSDRGAIAQPVGDPNKAPIGTGDLQRQAIDELFVRLDANKDDRLSADEVTPRFRGIFGSIDIDRNGYASRAEFAHAIAADSARAGVRGPVVADRIVAVVDNFIVEVYQNGERVPDARRKQLVDIHGASVEEIRIEVRKGDSIVFNVVNNRFRWDGASYFAAVGTRDGSPGNSGLATSLTTGAWTRCDDPSQVAAFLADPKFLEDQSATGIEKAWWEGDSLLAKHAGGARATPIWGASRNTWLRCVVR